jgi:hypothetical protein
MKSKLVFVMPGILLLAFLSFKPPAIGNQQGEVIVTPEATITADAKPHVRDFDDEGRHHDDDDDYLRSESTGGTPLAPIPAMSNGSIAKPDLTGMNDEEDDEDDDDEEDDDEDDDDEDD